jgi:hypothetical protein
VLYLIVQEETIINTTKECSTATTYEKTFRSHGVTIISAMIRADLTRRVAKKQVLFAYSCSEDISQASQI